MTPGEVERLAPLSKGGKGDFEFWERRYSEPAYAFGTGCPQKSEMLYTLDLLREDLTGLKLEVGREAVRAVVEGIDHTGRAAVVQILARR
jgi:hypothetical protein